MHLPSGCCFPDLFQSTHMHIMLSTFAYISLASDLIVVAVGGWWRGLCGIKVLQQHFVLKMQGGLSARGSIFVGHYSTSK